MTVSVNVAKVQITTPGGTAGPFQLSGPAGALSANVPSDLVVTFLPNGGNPASLIYGADYSIIGDITVGAASLQSNAALAAGLLTVRRVTPVIQETEWEDGDGNPSARFETTEDYGRYIDQEAQEASARAIAIPDFLPAASSPDLPLDFFGGGKLLAWDPETSKLTTSDPSVTQAQAAAAQAIAAASALTGAAWFVANTLTALRAIPSAQALASPNATLRSFAGTPGDGAFGFWFWNAADTRTDNGGMIVKPQDLDPDDAGRWNRSLLGLSEGAFHTGWFGVVGDNATDNRAALQACIDAAYNDGNNEVYVDPTAELINFSDTLTLYPGTIIRGHGGNLSGNASGISRLQCTYRSATTHPAFQMLCADGEAVVEAPKFYDLYLVADYGLQLNSSTGGFSDDGTTQNVQYNFIMHRCTFQAFDFYATGGHGIWLSKFQRGSIRDCLFQGYDFNVGLEGSDNFKIDNCYFGGAGTSHIEAVTHPTFGNALDVDHCVFESLQENAEGADIHSSYQQLQVHNCFHETAGPAAAAYWLHDMVNANVVIRDNFIGANGVAYANWLRVDDTTTGAAGQGNGLVNLVVEGNSGGSLTNGALFNNGAGITYYTGAGGARRRICHKNNVQDSGFPCNSLSSSLDGVMLQPSIVAYFSPNLDGLNFENLGKTIEIASGAFVAGATGAGNTISFGNTDRPRPIGNFKLWVLASSGSGSNIHGAVTDNDVPTSVYGAQALTATPQWYEIIADGQACAAGAGCTFYFDNSDVHLYAAVLSQ